jgi:hypothetical protein
LKPGGRFVFDVNTFRNLQSRWSGTSWQVAPEGGFWKPGPYLVLQQGFHYPEADTALEQFLVIEDDGTMTVYRNWFHYYSVETISAVLEGQGFTVEGVYGDLTGAPLTDDGEWIGVIAQKKP